MDINNQQEQQIPITISKGDAVAASNTNSAPKITHKRRSNNSLRARTYSDTDSSYMPGKF